MKRKYFLPPFAACALVLFSILPLRAESVFLRDGSILEGKIVKETDQALTLRAAGRQEQVIPRKDILRSVYSDDYKNRVYLYRMDGSSIEAYIVDEDREQYVYRLDLASPKEQAIAKKKVNFVAKNRPMPVSAKGAEAAAFTPGTREEGLRTRAPLLRLGVPVCWLGPGEPDFNGFSVYYRQPLAALDVFLYRARNTAGNGFDLYAGGSMTSHRERSTTLAGEVGYLGYDEINSEEEIHHVYIYKGRLSARYVHGLYLLDILWQGYVLAGSEFAVIDYDIEYHNPDEQNSRLLYSFGVHGGAGVEIGLFPHGGLYTEVTYGYLPVFLGSEHFNFEGLTLTTGVTWRTSFL